MTRQEAALYGLQPQHLAQHLAWSVQRQEHAHAFDELYGIKRGRMGRGSKPVPGTVEAAEAEG